LKEIVLPLVPTMVVRSVPPVDECRDVLVSDADGFPLGGADQRDPIRCEHQVGLLAQPASFPQTLTA
jgi:hypothetical protein